MHNPHLHIILILLAAAVVIVALFRKLRASPVLGYLVAGAIIGPSGTGVLSDISTIHDMAEFGVVFLLFIIGLELSWDRLRSLRRHIVTIGLGQLILTTMVLAGFLCMSGLPLIAAIISGGGLALSSTALALQIIEERQQKASQLGRLSLAVLLAQDLGVVPLLVLVPVLAHSAGEVYLSILSASGKALLALLMIVFVGRRILTPLYRTIASLNNPEIFTALTLLMALGTAWLTAEAGLSLTLGAFLAGLILAETEYRHQVEADALPYKGLFLGLFFMAVGMSANTRLLFQQFPLILSYALGLMAIKAGLLFTICRLYDITKEVSVKTAFYLSQGSEFAFVLFPLAVEKGFLRPEQAQMFVLVVTLSMALTPFAAWLSRRLAVTRNTQCNPHMENFLTETSDLRDHVIILGFGRVGQTIAKLLSAENIQYVAIDTQIATISKARIIGLPVYFGDGSRKEVLHAIGVERASAAIITLSDPIAGERAARALKGASAALPVIARAHDLEGVLALEGAGANIAIAEMFETSLQLGGALLKALSVDEHEIIRIIEIFRDRDYALTRGILEVAPELHHTPYGKMLAFQNVVKTEGVVKG